LQDRHRQRRSAVRGLAHDAQQQRHLFITLGGESHRVKLTQPVRAMHDELQMQPLVAANAGYLERVEKAI
jgi:hypothetical protein